MRQPEVQRRVDELSEDGLSALHYAARFNHLEMVQLLVEECGAGARVTSLLIASQLLILCVNISDAEVRDDEGATPLHYCARKKQQDDAKV